MTSNKLAIAGTVFLAVAVGCVVYLITDFLYHLPAAAIATAIAIGFFGWFWYGLPLLRRRSAPPYIVSWVTPRQANRTRTSTAS